MRNALQKSIRNVSPSTSSSEERKVQRERALSVSGTPGSVLRRRGALPPMEVQANSNISEMRNSACGPPQCGGRQRQKRQQHREQAVSGGVDASLLGVRRRRQDLLRIRGQDTGNECFTVCGERLLHMGALDQNGFPRSASASLSFCSTAAYEEGTPACQVPGLRPGPQAGEASRRPEERKRNRERSTRVCLVREGGGWHLGGSRQGHRPIVSAATFDEVIQRLTRAWQGGALPCNHYWPGGRRSPEGRLPDYPGPPPSVGAWPD